MTAGVIKSADKIPILMYHSISTESGPTSIAPAIFEAQIRAIADAGWNVAPLAAYADWRLRNATLPPRTLIITFDDAYQDFAESAFPVLERYNFPATVFVPTALVGGVAAWDGSPKSGKPIMGWDTIHALAAKDIAFAPHSRTHARLTGLEGEELRAEIVGSGQDVLRELGAPARYFAPPYGETNREVDTVIRTNYEISVGVGLGIATRNSPVHALPRLEMLYYRDLKRWTSFLSGTGGIYLAARQYARAVRRLLTPGPGAPYG